MRVLSVDSADPFLPTLAARVADGTLWPDGRLPDDPLALADATIYLPTRRAARALAAAFLAVAPGRATALPRPGRDFVLPLIAFFQLLRRSRVRCGEL